MKFNLFKCLTHAASGCVIILFTVSTQPVYAAGGTKAATPLYKSYAWVAPMSKAERKVRLSNAQKRQMARNQSAKGSGSWICSPSGFVRPVGLVSAHRALHAAEAWEQTSKFFILNYKYASLTMFVGCWIVRLCVAFEKA